MASKEEHTIFALLNELGEIKDKVFDEHIILDFSDTEYTLDKQKSLLFKNVTFNATFTFINFKLEHLPIIEIDQCVFFDNVVFKNVSVPYMYFQISNCTFHQKSPLRFSDSSLSLFQFDENKIDSCNLNNIQTNELIINNCSVKKYLSIRNIDCDYTEITNEKGNHCNRILIDSPKVKEAIIQSKDSIDSLYISELQTAYISGEYNNINISSKDFTHIEISNLGQRDIPDRLAKIGVIKFQDTNFQGLLTLEELDIENLSFQGLNMTNGSVRFNEITIKDTSIYDCTVSNFYWNQVRFINPPEIKRSDVSELKMSNVSWQKGKRLKNSFLDEKVFPFYRLRKRLQKSKRSFNDIDISDLKYQIETYRQLKAASIANHNPIEGLEFYRNEMKLYWKLIRLEGGIPWYDRFLVFLNRIVSDFGQNWFLPLVWIAITTVIYYFIVEQPALSYYPKDIGNGILEVLYYVNPVRRIDADLTKSAQGLDVLFRVLSAYFIYHLIKASRKFGKV